MTRAMTTAERSVERRFVGLLVAVIVALHVVGGAILFATVIGCRCGRG
jgi:hypothetical protein